MAAGTFVAPKAVNHHHRHPPLISTPISLTGNADGLGPLRSQEMYHACSLLGIDAPCVTVVDDPRLPDGMKSVWPLHVVAEHVEAALHESRAQIVCLFLVGGV